MDNEFLKKELVLAHTSIVGLRNQIKDLENKLKINLIENDKINEVETDKEQVCKYCNKILSIHTKIKYHYNTKLCTKQREINLSKHNSLFYFS